MICNFFIKYKILFYSFIALCTSLTISWYSYLRFLRERLARDIPFSLTELWFYFLLLICINYIYAIKATIKPTVPNTTIVKILSYIAYLALPFLILDRVIKTNKYTYLSTVKSTETIAPPSGGKGQRILYLILHLIPRIILVLIFIMDVFWFQKLYYFYYFLFLSLFPIIYNYHKFSMYQAKEIEIQHLESLYDKNYVEVVEIGWNTSTDEYEYKYDHDGIIREIPITSIWKSHTRNKYHLAIVTIREYIQIILEKEVDEIENEYEDYYELEPEPIAETHVLSEYKKINNKTTLDSTDYAILDKVFHDLIPHITRLSLLLHYLPQNEKRRYITCLNILIYSLYIIGWGYILIKSISSLSDLPLTVDMLKSLTEYIEEINPFINP